jgi:hypothetical protein
VIHIEFPKGKAVCGADTPEFEDGTSEPDCPQCIADHDRVTSDWLFSKEGERSMAALEQELIAEGNSPYPPVDPFSLEAHKIKSKVWPEMNRAEDWADLRDEL